MTATEMNDFLKRMKKERRVNDFNSIKSIGSPCERCSFSKICPRQTGLICMAHMRDDKRSITYKLI